MDLQKLRKKIDLVDIEMVKLLNQRMELALRTKKFKQTVPDPVESSALPVLSARHRLCSSLREILRRSTASACQAVF